MTPTKELILRDLGHNFRTKIDRDITDFLSLCGVAELDTRDVAADLMCTFVHLTAAMAANHFDVSAQDLASVMTEQFIKAKKRSEATGS